MLLTVESIGRIVGDALTKQLSLQDKLTKIL